MLTAPLLLSLALAAPTAPAGVFPYQLHETKLDNGLRIVVVPTDKRGFFALYEVVGTGSRDEVEAGHSGFAHFFEHIMFRGTKAFPADARTGVLAKLGVDESGYTTDDFTGYSLSGPSAGLDEILALEADRYQNLWFSEDDFKTESRAVLGEYNKNFSNPDQKAYEVLSNLAFDQHTYKHTTMGFLADIQRMPQEYSYAKKFFERFYRPDNLMFIIAGDVDVDAVTAAMKKHFGAWKGKRAVTTLKDEPALTAERRENIGWDNPTQDRVHLGWRVPSTTRDPRTAALSLLLAEYSFAPSSDLVKGLTLGDPSSDRGEALADKVSCWWDLHKDAALFPVAVRLKDGKSVDDAIARVQNHLNDVSAGKVNSRRFEDVKSHLRYALLMRFTSPDGVAGTLAWLSGPSMDPGAIDAVFGALDSLTPADLAQFAKAHFQQQQRAVVVLHHGDVAKASAKTGGAK